MRLDSLLRLQCNLLFLILCIGFVLITAGCSTTNNNGSCDAQGAANAVNCGQPVQPSNLSSSQSPSPSAPDSKQGPPNGSSGLPPSPSPSATQLAVVYLSDMDDQSGSAIAEPVTIKGTSYIHSIHYGDENSGGGLGQGTGERDAEFSYDLGGVHYSSFDAMLGFLDEPTDPEAVVQFTVKVDGVTVASESCSRYSACPIHAKLPVGSQLTLSMQLIKWTPTSQIDYFPDAYPAWGDARLR